MAHRFVRYEKINEAPVQVEGQVLFGDKEDVNLKWVGVEPEKSQGGTINFTITHSVKAVPGKYQHGMLTLEVPIHWSNLKETHEMKYHIVHHEKADGTALGKWLCSVDGHDIWNLPNIINRYDWCHYRNWERRCVEDVEDSEPDSEGEWYPWDDTEDFEDSDWAPDEEQRKRNREIKQEKLEDMERVREEKLKRAEERDKLRKELAEDDPCRIYFVAVSKDGKEEVGRFKLHPDDVISGDWYYGLRVVDPEQGAFAFGFGDALRHYDSENLEPCNDFNVPIYQFEKALQNEE